MLPLKVIFRNPMEAIRLGGKVFSKVGSGSASVEIVLKLKNWGRSR